MIFCSIILVFFKNKIKFRINFFRISILSFVGTVHGLTNSGGTLMSLAFSADNEKDYARLNTTFFYLLLAIFQYLLTTVIFYDQYTYPSELQIFYVLLIGIVLGNIINKFLKNTVFKIIVNFLAIMSAIILLVK